MALYFQVSFPCSKTTFFSYSFIDESSLSKPIFSLFFFSHSFNETKPNATIKYFIICLGFHTYLLFLVTLVFRVPVFSLKNALNPSKTASNSQGSSNVLLPLIRIDVPSRTTSLSAFLQCIGVCLFVVSHPTGRRFTNNRHH